jgi:pimeloyl-ACP methyl ester carboxylesterase
MRAAFELFKAFNNQDAEDNRKFAVNKLPMPVLTIEGDKSMGGALEIQANLVSDNATSIQLADTGHWLVEQRPAETKAALKEFFGN